MLVDGVRRLTPREMLRLQGFPDEFKIVVSDAQTRITHEWAVKKLHIKVKKPELIDKETLLKTVKFDNSWYTVIR